MANKKIWFPVTSVKPRLFVFCIKSLLAAGGCLRACVHLYPSNVCQDKKKKKKLILFSLTLNQHLRLSGSTPGLFSMWQLYPVAKTNLSSVNRAVFRDWLQPLHFSFKPWILELRPVILSLGVNALYGPKKLLKVTSPQNIEDRTFHSGSFRPSGVVFKTSIVPLW